MNQNDEPNAELQRIGVERGDEIGRAVVQLLASGAIPKGDEEAVAAAMGNLVRSFEAEMRLVGFDDDNVRVASDACVMRVREALNQLRGGVGVATESKQ